MADIKNRSARRAMRHSRVRKKGEGTAQRPRLVVYKSAKNVYVQAVDDTAQKSITGASSLSPEIRESLAKKPKTQKAAEVGKLIAKRLKENKIETVVFDRNGYKYHGVIKALAEAVREAKLLA